MIFSWRKCYITTPLSRCLLTLTGPPELTLPLFPCWPQLKSSMKALLFNHCISAYFLVPLMLHSSLTAVQFIDRFNVQTHLTHHIAFLYSTALFSTAFHWVSLSPSYHALGKHSSFFLSTSSLFTWHALLFVWLFIFLWLVWLFVFFFLIPFVILWCRYLLSEQSWEG